MTTLLTFLGRVPKAQGSYRKTLYEFPDGSPAESAAFFGWPLLKRLAATKLVIMGTNGSMWDHLFEGDIPFGNEVEEARLRLVEATEKKAVTASDLEPLRQPLAQRLGCEVHFVIIPYCRTVQEQAEVIARMAEHVGRGDAVHIDVSHGFRHLPIIAILSALYLRVVRNAEIAGIWYAAFDPDSGEAEVHDLKGLLGIVDWVQALHTYDKDGDYGVFAPLLGPSGTLLEQASFHERTTNPVRARAAISTWSSLPDRFPANDPAASLFSEELERRVRWYRQPSRDCWEKELALRYLEQRDYVRCAIFAVESVLSADIVRANADPDLPKLREEAEKARKMSGKDGFPELKRIRNSLAHGGRPRDDGTKAALSEEAQLRARLESLLARLLGPSKIRG